MAYGRHVAVGLQLRPAHGARSKGRAPQNDSGFGIGTPAASLAAEAPFELNDLGDPLAHRSRERAMARGPAALAESSSGRLARSCRNGMVARQLWRLTNA